MKKNSLVRYRGEIYYVAKTYKNMEGMFGLKPLDRPKNNCIIVHNYFLDLIQE